MRCYSRRILRHFVLLALATAALFLLPSRGRRNSSDNAVTRVPLENADIAPVSSALATVAGNGSRMVDGGLCSVLTGHDRLGGDFMQLDSTTREGCCEACKEHSDHCKVAVFCSLSATCFMKDRRAFQHHASRKAECDLLRLNADKDFPEPNWLPQHKPMDDLLALIPDEASRDKAVKSSNGYIAKHERTQAEGQRVRELAAWELLKERLRHNARAWEGLGVRYTAPRRALRIMFMHSPAVLYRMNWKTGEHLQGGDVLFALLKLGHKVWVPATFHGKQWQMDHSRFDLILTDYAGAAELFKVALPRPSQKNRLCKLRILDTFGTSQDLNDPDGKQARPPLMPAPLRLALSQFWGYYPDVAPGSTFIGLAISTLGNYTAATVQQEQPTGNCAVLWGKMDHYMMVTKNSGWLSQVSLRMKIFATIDERASHTHAAETTGKQYRLELPPFIENLGLLSNAEYGALLNRCDVLIGLGQPLWGNAPLDALAAGMIILLPSFSPPLGTCATCTTTTFEDAGHQSSWMLHWPASVFVGDKHSSSKLVDELTAKLESIPNHLGMTSQNPYVEAIGEPDVFTLPLRAVASDRLAEKEQLERTLDRIEEELESRRAGKGDGFRSRLPLEWTAQAFVDRVAAATEEDLGC